MFKRKEYEVIYKSKSKITDDLDFIEREPMIIHARSLKSAQRQVKEWVKLDKIYLQEVCRDSITIREI